MLTFFVSLQLISAESKVRVVVAQDPGAIERFEPNGPRVTRLMESGMLTLTGKSSGSDAWGQFVGSNDVVGIKIVARGGPLFSVRKEVVDGIIAGVRSAGVPENRIIVWDKYQNALMEAGYRIQESTNGVRIVGTIPWIGFDPDVRIRSPEAGKIIWGDLSFRPDQESVSAESYFSRIVTREVTKLINVVVLVNHTEVGLSGCLFNAAIGSVDNTRRFETSAAASERAVPQLFAAPVLHNKLVLHIVDGLLGQYALGPNFHPEFTWHFGAIYFSTDPVALDTIALEEIEVRRKHAGLPSMGHRAAYIHTAAALGLGTDKRDDIQVIEAGRK